MKKILLAAILIFVIGGYALWSSSRQMEAPMATASTPSETTNPNTGTTAPSTTYKDGTYTGSIANAFYGNLQVVATIQGGKIVDITYPVYPNDRAETVQVNSEALPILKQEAIAAQSAKVDIVTGATQSSQAFQESLGVALAQAQS